MSRFSLVNVIGRRSTINENDNRPSIISVDNLNRRLNEESHKVHLFLGPGCIRSDGKVSRRILHGERKIQKSNKKIWLVSEPQSLGEADSKASNASYLGSVASSISAAGKFLEQKVAQMKTTSSYVNEDSFCDGCGMDPIIGDMYTCSECDNYSLCESCYQSGVHGYEESALLKSLREDFALRNVMDLTRHRVPEEVFSLLMTKVCRGQIDRFNFLANWICDVVLDHPISTLSVRGIEIPHLETEIRSRLIQNLTPALAVRADMEVCMEWFSPNANNKNLTGAERRLETLRIWVSTDKDSKSPFAHKPKVRINDSTLVAEASDTCRSPRTSQELSELPDTPNSISSPSISRCNSIESPETPPSSVHSDEMDNLNLESERSSDIAPRLVQDISSSGVPQDGIEI